MLTIRLTPPTSVDPHDELEVPDVKTTPLAELVEEVVPHPWRRF